MIIATESIIQHRPPKELESINITDCINETIGLVGSVLPRGAENGITGNELMKLIGLSDKRVLRAMIARERESSIILYDPRSHVYYRPPAGLQGVLDTTRHRAYMRKMALNILRDISFENEALKQYDIATNGQYSLPLDIGA